MVVSICYSRLGKKKKRKRKNLNKLGSNENIHKKIVYLKINVLHLQQLLKRRRRKKKEKKGGGELGGGEVLAVVKKNSDRWRQCPQW